METARGAGRSTHFKTQLEGNVRSPPHSRETWPYHQLTAAAKAGGAPGGPATMPAAPNGDTFLLLRWTQMEHAWNILGPRWRRETPPLCWPCLLMTMMAGFPVLLVLRPTCYEAVYRKVSCVREADVVYLRHILRVCNEATRLARRRGSPFVEARSMDCHHACRSFASDHRLNSASALRPPSPRIDQIEAATTSSGTQQSM
jgi:hypothetical protein